MDECVQKFFKPNSRQLVGREVRETGPQSLAHVKSPVGGLGSRLVVPNNATSAAPIDEVAVGFGI
jgi:hypothetical protein